MTKTAETLLGDLGPLERHRWEALQNGRIEYQRCKPNHHAWLPPLSRCPTCLSSAWAWEVASGQAELVSWVVYHRAFHPAYEPLVPYSVALVKLVEGPQMISSLKGYPGDTEPWCGAPVLVAPTSVNGVMLAQARLAETSSH